MGGSGRRLAVKLAASTNEAELFQVEVTRVSGFFKKSRDLKKTVFACRTDSNSFLLQQISSQEKSFRRRSCQLLWTACSSTAFVTHYTSPIGDSLKKRIRVNPSLFKCCTIGRYTSWPEDASQKVAEYFVKSMTTHSRFEAPAQPQRMTRRNSWRKNLSKC